MTITRSPTREELACLICHKPGVAFDHIKERSTHPQLKDEPTNIAPLCPACHQLKSDKRIKTWTDASPMLEPPWFYCWRKADSDLVIRVPVRVDERHQCLVPNSEAEATDGSSLEVQQASASELAGEGTVGAPVVEVGGFPPSSPSPAPAGPGLTNDTAVGAQPGLALMDAEGEPEGSEGVPASGYTAVGRSPSAFSLIDGCREGMQLLYWGLKLKDATDEFRWQIGDWLVRMEEELGEPAYQYFEPIKEAFGYDAIRQYKSVAERVPAVTRVTELSWSHHRAVAALPEKAQAAALLTARDESLSSREVTAMVRPAPPERERHTCSCGNVHWLEIKGEWKA